MAEDARWLVIVNPASGRPGGRGGWLPIEQALRDARIAFDVVRTGRPGHGEQLARDAVTEGRRRLAVAGGDGSVNEALQGIMNAGLADTRDVTLAVMPTGTGNDWARSLGISRRPEDIARMVAAGRTMLHDVGAIDLAGPHPTRRWFINVAGAGYDAYVSARVPRPVPGAFAYLRIALQSLAEYRAPEFHIRADGVTVDGRLLLAFVANARYCGNRMHVAPTALMDDGLLDLVAVREVSLLQVLSKLVKLYGGRILGDPVVRHLQAARVRLETDPTTIIQADGQVVGETPAEFSLLPRALRVAVP